MRDAQPYRMINIERPAMVREEDTALLDQAVNDLLDLAGYGALPGVAAVLAERLRQAQGGKPERIDGRAYEAALKAQEIDREVIAPDSLQPWQERVLEVIRDAGEAGASTVAILASMEDLRDGLHVLPTRLRLNGWLMDRVQAGVFERRHPNGEWRTVQP